MPKIPQASFNTTPSTRVGNIRVNTQGGTGTDAVTKAAASFTGAMAKLQDQSERTEAYNFASGVTEKYKAARVDYKNAVDNMDAQGNYSYMDPSDENPDVTKRKTISGNVNEKYKELQDIHRDGVDSSRALIRDDIAGDQMQQNIGNDLTNLQISTNRARNRKAIKATGEAVMKNIDFNFNDVMEGVANGLSADLLSAKIDQLEGKNSREIATAGPTVGAETSAKMTEYNDGQFGKYASEILKEGVTNTNVAVSEMLLNKIKDPVMKSKATRQFNRVKKTTVQHTNMTTMNSANNWANTVAKQDRMDDQTYLKSISHLRKLDQMYIDPALSDISREDVDAQKAELMSTIVAKKYLQDNWDQDNSFLVEGGESAAIPLREGLTRGPSGEDEALAEIQEEINSNSVLKQLTGSADFNAAMMEKTKSKLKSLYSDSKRSLPEIAQAANPQLSGRALYDKITIGADANGFGDPPLIGRKDVSEFRKDFKSSLAKDFGDASDFFYGRMAEAGVSQEGTSSYRRALAIDLADKDPDMKFLVAAADIDSPTLQDEMFKNAAVFKEKKAELDITQDNLDDHWVKSGYMRMPSIEGTPFYRGIKQAIQYEAVANSQGKGDMKDSMDAAIEKYSSFYTVVNRPNGDAVIAANFKGGTDYSEKKGMLEKGMDSVKGLRNIGISYKEKARILAAIEPRAVLFNRSGNPTTPEKDIEFALSRGVKIEPSSRWPNMVNLKTNNGALITDSNGEVMQFTTEQLIQAGTQSTSQDLAERKKFDPAFSSRGIGKL